MRTHFLRAVCALFLLVLVNGCATPITANTDFDDRYDFSGVHKVAIRPIDRTEVSNITVSDMQVMRINEALIAELQSKGLEVVADDSAADLYLTWHLVTEQRTDVRTYDSMSYYNCWRCGPSVSDVSVRQYTQGTFIIDMIDPVRNRSVWRSVIQSEMRPQQDPAKAAQFRKDAAAAALAQFPPA